MYLQLAEGEEEVNPYILIPDPTFQKKGIYVREDLFDDLSPGEFNKLMRELAPFQASVQGGMSESNFLGDRASRKAKREQRRTDKHLKKEAKTNIKNARAENKRSGKSGSVLKDVMGSIGGIAGSIFGGGGGDSAGTEADLQPDGSPPTDPGTPPKKDNTMTYVLVGASVLALGGIGYAMTRKKKK